MNIKRKYITVVIFIASLQLHAQLVPPPIPPPPPPGLPIDQGVLFLLLGGVVYGVKKILGKS